MNANSEKLKFIQKLGYGIGDFGSNYCWTFVASFILIYCTNILGINAAVIGTIMLFSKLLDGISDIFAGRIIDKTKSKMGKARFWYFISSFPVAICVFLLFNIPAGFSENTQSIYIFIVYTLMGAVFYTLNNIAYSSLTALVTKDAEDRVALGSYRFIFSMLAQICISGFTPGLVEYFGGGQPGWFYVSLIYSVVCLVTLLVPVISVKELDENQEKTETVKQDELSFTETLKLLFKNKYFILIFIYYFFTYLSEGISQGLGIYYTTYALNNPGFLGIISMAMMLPIAIALPFIPKLTTRFGIKQLSLFGGIIGVVGTLIAFWAGSQGVMTVLVIGLVLKALGATPIFGSRNALIAEADDYTRMKTGYKITGSIFACSSVGIKLGTGVGTALSGFLLDASGYNGLAQVQDVATITAIQNMYFFSLILAATTIVATVYFMNVERDNKELRAKLKLDLPN